MPPSRVTGFFVVQDPSGNTHYTRAGNFQTDNSGNLLTNTGDYVQGWTTLNAATGQVDTNGPSATSWFRSAR